MQQKSLVKNSIFNLIYTAANILFPFLTSIYVSRILLPADVGRVAYAQNIASYFVTIAALGLPSYGVREFAKVREDPVRKNRLFTELLLLNFVSTTLSAGGYLLLVRGSGAGGGDWPLYLACGLLIFFNYINIDWLYQGLEEYGYIAGRSILIKMLSLLALLMFVRSRQDYVAYALITSLASGANYLFNIIHARRMIRLDFTGLRLRRHIRPVLVIAVIVFLSGIYSKIDTTMLGLMATEESIGYYTYAQKTLTIVLNMSAAVTAAMLSRLSFYYDNDRPAFFRLLQKGFEVLCLLAMPLCAGLFLVAPQAVAVLYGAAYAPAALTIRLMCPLVLIKGFGDLFCYQLVYSTKNEKIVVPASALASVINIFANAALIPPLLQNGAVIASVFSELTTNLMQFLYVRRKIGFSLHLRPLAVSLGSTAAMSVCVWLLSHLGLPDLPALVLEIAAGGAVYFALNLAAGSELLRQTMRRLLRR